MKTLLILMGVIETVTGVGLLAFPSLIASLLLGSSLGGPVGLVVARLCGAALLSLGMACVLARPDRQAAGGLIIGMLVYNTTATALLTYSFFALGLMGLALWPAIAVHAALAIWCVACLRSDRAVSKL